MESLAEALPKEQKRVRELVTRYRDPELKGAGEMAAKLMERDLEFAENTSAAGDLAGMISAYHALKGWES